MQLLTVWQSARSSFRTWRVAVKTTTPFPGTECSASLQTLECFCSMHMLDCAGDESFGRNNYSTDLIMTCGLHYSSVLFTHKLCQELKQQALFWLKLVKGNISMILYVISFYVPFQFAARHEQVQHTLFPSPKQQDIQFGNIVPQSHFPSLSAVCHNCNILTVVWQFTCCVPSPSESFPITVSCLS